MNIISTILAQRLERLLSVESSYRAPSSVLGEAKSSTREEIAIFCEGASFSWTNVETLDAGEDTKPVQPLYLEAPIAVKAGELLMVTGPVGR